MKITGTVCSGRDIRTVFVDALDAVQYEGAYKVTIKECSSRTLAQNRKMWSCLNDIAKQCRLHGEKLSAEEWKHVFTAAKCGQRIVTGICGELVVLGKSTSDETIKFMSELIEIIHAYGAENNVLWSDPAEKALMDYPEAKRA